MEDSVLGSRHELGSMIVFPIRDMGLDVRQCSLVSTAGLETGQCSWVTTWAGM